MSIRSAKFIKSVVEADDILDDGKPQIAFIGRSNVGKSSIINALTKQKGLARTSSFPGRTQQINLFLINKTFYLVDLPGYGYAKASHEGREKIRELIYWYLLDSDYEQKKVVFIMDANVGLTENDLDMLRSLEKREKDIIVVANKIDKIKKAGYQKQLQKIHGKIKELGGNYKVIPCSSEKGTGINELRAEILK